MRTNNLVTDSTSWQNILGVANNGPNSGYVLANIRDVSSKGMMLGDYSSAIAFGGNDTKGVLNVSYASHKARIWGGNGSAPIWSEDIAWKSDITSLNNNITAVKNNLNNVYTKSDSDGRYINISGDTLASGALLKWANSGHANDANNAGYVAGGLEWSGKTDWIKIHAVETGADNLDLITNLGDDSSNRVVFQWNGNEKAAINSAGTFTGNINWDHINNRPATNMSVYMGDIHYANGSFSWFAKNFTSNSVTNGGTMAIDFDDDQALRDTATELTSMRNRIANAESNINSLKSKDQVISKADYDKLSDAQKNNGTLYWVTE